jgi:predicted RNA binding protein YcfA (HicA-like mRNA interferase family)
VNPELATVDVRIPRVTKLPVVSGREVIRALERAGFVQVSVKGSHCKLFHDEGT